MITKTNEYIEIFGAKAHNLKNINLKIPRNSLVTITGLSGSGKSSLAFDTVYAEGQRRYLETFSTYIRSFLGNMERPEVDKITGLSPVIAIEQKSTNKNPRSTVGTVTEIYDLLRLLYARIADAYSVNTGEKMVKYTEDQIIKTIVEKFFDREISILAPQIKGRKGHYRELFQQIAGKGYTKVRVDGEIKPITFGMKLDRYKIHDIEIVVDTFQIKDKNIERLKRSIKTAFKGAGGNILILDEESKEAKYYSKNLMCPTTGISYPDAEPNTFSFNSPYGACPRCKGLGEITQVDLDKLIVDNNLSISKGAIAAINTNDKTSSLYKKINSICKKYECTTNTKLKDLPKECLDEILFGEKEVLEEEDVVEEENNIDEFDLNLGASFYDLNSFKGIVNLIKNATESDAPAAISKWANGFISKKTCPECEGKRLKKESLSYRIKDKNIADLTDMDITELDLWVNNLPNELTKRQLAIGEEIIREISTKINFLINVGLGYLHLSQKTASLSGGEAQRIRLATQIGSELVNVLYILDEPSIGLHQSDNIKLINSLKQLRDKGNSVIVVEHDKEMMLASDWIIDIGEGAGVHGGRVVAAGKPLDFLETGKEGKISKHLTGITADYLNGKRKIDIPKERRKPTDKYLSLLGASGNNLKDVDLRLPLGVFVCITGVSGSGKSSLINDTLHPVLAKHYHRAEKKALPYKSVEGLENIDKVIEIDQTPIGRNPRSNPATYIGVFDDIRALFAMLPTAKIRGYQPGRFSFNIKGGRCEACFGGGVKVLEMKFLPDVYVTCDECHGKRYNRETLEVRYKGKSINDVLNMSFTEALAFFENYPLIVQKLSMVTQVGLGYLTLGQSSTTLSGGEAQRIKLATELARKDTGRTLYILDEPTTGLHFEDIRILLNVLQKLVDKGNSMVVIEHNLDVIKVADYIIDMGKESGVKGGQIVFCGTPEEAIKDSKNSIGEYLKDEL